MGFFDKLSDVAKQAGDAIEKGVKNVSETSKKVADKAKLKREISQKENEINAVYIKIGKKYAEEMKNSASPEYAEMLGEIAKAKSEIEALNVELMNLEEKCICPVCKAEIEKDAKFCISCGTKLEKTEPVVYVQPNEAEPKAEEAAANPSESADKTAE